MVERGRLHGREDINARVQKLLAEYKVGKYYKFETRDDGFDFKVDEMTMAVDAAHIAKDNSVLADKQLARWKQHMKTIARRMEQLRQRIEHGQLHGKATIGVRVGKVLNKYKVGKHFKLDIRDDAFSFEIDKKKVEAEAALDGIYVIRTSLSAQQMNTEDTVRSYKLLTQVERAFRSFKTMDLKVRPIRHRLENRVRAHIFLCMLAYYVEWHMLEAWRPVLFSDEDQNAKASRDPVAPAKRSQAALRKVRSNSLLLEVVYRAYLPKIFHRDNAHHRPIAVLSEMAMAEMRDGASDRPRGHRAEAASQKARRFQRLGLRRPRPAFGPRRALPSRARGDALDTPPSGSPPSRSRPSGHKRRTLRETRRRDKRLAECSRECGAPRRVTARRTMVPQARPSLAGRRVHLVSTRRARARTPAFRTRARGLRR